MAMNVTRSSMPDYEEYCKEIEPLWDSRWLTNCGSLHESLQGRLTEYLKTKHTILFANGHLALEAALAVLGLSGEVITTPFTFASTTQAIVRCGLTPVFCDIKETDCTIDPEKIEALITEKTTAILPVHVYGSVCDVNEIERIAKKYNLKVIYDAAHAFGVELDGKGIGSFGDCSMFSFHATKVFNTIEGGCVTYADELLTETLKAQRNFGMTGPQEYSQIAGNSKMNEFQAAMGLCNLRHVNDEIKKRKAIVKRYQENLKGVDSIRFWQEQSNVTHNYAYFPVFFEDGLRDIVSDRLAKHEIYARKYFYPLTSSFACYQGKFDIQLTPVAQRMADNGLTLPLYADMTLEEVDFVCDIIKNSK